jgi:hypothetical protein
MQSHWFCPDLLSFLRQGLFQDGEVHLKTQNGPSIMKGRIVQGADFDADLNGDQN